MGKAGSAHGLDGSFAVELINNVSPMWREKLAIKLISTRPAPAEPQEYISEIQQIKGKVQKKIILKMPLWASPESVKEVLPLDVWVRREDFLTLLDSEVYLQDLIGYDVVDQDGKFIALVKGFAENKTQNLLILGDAGETMIPYVPAWIKSVDTVNRLLVITSFSEL
jgi:16S rRNA processing protein RimM